MCYLVGVSPSEICKWCMTKINLIVVTKTFVILVSLDKIRFHPKYLFFSFPDTLLPSRHGATRERHGGVQCLHHVARAVLQRVSKPALHPPAGDQGSGSVLCFKCCSRQSAGLFLRCCQNSLLMLLSLPQKGFPFRDWWEKSRTWTPAVTSPRPRTSILTMSCCLCYWHIFELVFSDWNCSVVWCLF